MQFYRRPKPIKAISFDLDDTLYDNAPVIARLETELMQWLYQRFPITQHVSAMQWQQLKQQIARAYPELSEDLAALRRETIVVMLKQLGVSTVAVAQAAQEGMALVAVMRNQIDVPHETHQVLKQLAAHYPLVAITNGNADIAQIGIDQYFEFALHGGVNGAAKPASDLFVLATERLGIDMGGLLHVGDHLDSDVAGAKKAGAMACWINLHHRRMRLRSEGLALPDLEITALSQLLPLLPTSA
ncbi:5-amino-6-(5-phospho-D-ribitylamino)uracil phosphatase YigB [Thaumasiovibrio sp. DFM-14]|uniref:5-amino-6-(5-phospho-D-ribitylamino)uracil phosphatase YigB n=1 Tax=Thaumasiovibrio sp. DFM-14 TaxID=3384792 RepID=UPI0039A2A933